MLFSVVPTGEPSLQLAECRLICLGRLWCSFLLQKSLTDFLNRFFYRQKVGFNFASRLYSDFFRIYFRLLLSLIFWEFCILQQQKSLLHFLTEYLIDSLTVSRLIFTCWRYSDQGNYLTKLGLHVSFTLNKSFFWVVKLGLLLRDILSI